MVPAALRGELLEMEPDGGVGTLRLHIPGTLHVGGVVADRFRNPASTAPPLVGEFHLSAAEITARSCPAVPAHAARRRFLAV